MHIYGARQIVERCAELRWRRLVDEKW